MLAASRDVLTPVDAARAFVALAQSVCKAFVVCDATHSSIVHGGGAASRYIDGTLDWVAELSRETVRARSGVALLPPLDHRSEFAGGWRPAKLYP